MRGSLDYIIMRGIYKHVHVVQTIVMRGGRNER